LRSPSRSTFSNKPRARRSDRPTEHVARITWMLVTLLSSGTLEYAAYRDHSGRSSRQFQRDAYQLREIGKTAGFIVSPRRSGRILLQTKNANLNWLGAQKGDATATLRRIAASLGGPVELEARQGIGDGVADMQHGFLHLRSPRPRKGPEIDGLFSFLKDATKSSARVEFTYTTAQGRKSVRVAEPYHVMGRSGRYYLIGYDVERRDWRQFALDAIRAPLRRVGTYSPRPVPERFLEERAVGWMRGGEEMRVTFRVSPLIAAAVASRQWQDNQELAELPNGGIELTIDFDDVNEAVRWALSFGTEAIIVAPPRAVAAARDTVERLAAAYAGDATLALVPRQIAG